MARCGCAGSTCTCVIEGSGSVVVSGGGSEANPFLVQGPVLNITDTPTVNLTKSGAGTAASPWNLSADATVTLDALTDVATAGATTGQVLGRKSDGTWGPQNPTSAAPAAINHDTSILGDGSAGSPLGVDLDGTASGLAIAAGGLRVDGIGHAGWQSYTPLLQSWDGLAPSVGNGSLTGRYAQIGKTVFMRAHLIIGSTTQRGTSYWSITLPVPAKIGQLQQMTAHLSLSAVADLVGSAQIGTSDNLRFNRLFFTGLSGDYRSYGLSQSRPSSIPSGSYIIIEGAYEAN